MDKTPSQGPSYAPGVRYETVDQTPAAATTRRDFLYLAAGAVGAVGAAGVGWAFIDSMNPAADVLALSSTEVDLRPVALGQGITVTWRGKPVFVRRRTPTEIEEAVNVNLADLRDPELDSKRVQKPEWLIVIGICTHLGCVPLGQKSTEPRGDYGGYLCPCHGSHYDTSARIRKGPAPKNLVVPTYKFVSDIKVVVG
jgi:ubiquinol-cytochrome c reductase iron-sulfur subunit